MEDDLNKWVGRGRVTQGIQRGRTGPGDEVCSFQITIKSRGNKKTCVRINCFDTELVRYAKNMVKPNRLVEIEGELMNRQKKGDGPKLMEVRAFSINVIKGGLK